MAGYAHYALHKLKILPRDFAEFSLEEKAFIIASIRLKIESEKKEMQKMKSKSRR
jgi:hypothetical protein|nr:MAG TPA: hypothetical protein [Caudoviricetes sp.]